MLTATDIHVQYGDRILLDGVNLVVGDRDKIGLVGRNGAGKSTLLKIIAGDLGSDRGQVVRPSESTLGFLHQEMELPRGRTVLDETLTAFAEIKRMERRLEEMNQEIAERTDYESDSYLQLLEDFAGLNDRFSTFGGVTMEAEAERVLKGLGFQDKDFVRQTQEFSGGWQMRIELAKMLLQRPDYLLLDEPTNHLDIESIIWLETWLADYTGAVITISHDQQFLDNITNRTVEVELGNLYDYKAAYSKYLEQRAERREKLQSAYDNQQKLIAQRERTINRFMAKATKTKMAQSMQKQLDKIERIELDDENNAAMNLRFPPAPRSGDTVLRAEGVHKKFGNLHVLRGVDLQIDRGDRLAFVGQNGQGKTTLAKILIDELPASSGEITMGHNVSVGYYAQNQSDKLRPDLTLLETLEEVSPPEMRTRLRSILGAFLFSGEDAEKKVLVLSGGERARLALAAMLLRPFNLLVLDEPTNHLDIISKNILKQALLDYDGTLIIVSHDREFLSGLTSRTIEFRDHRLFDHIGDVNAFLEKRKTADMRNLAISKPSAAPGHHVKPDTDLAAEADRPVLSYEERKRLQRDVSNAEKQIDRLEEKIAKLEQKMADPAFYDSGTAEAVAIEHADLQTRLQEAMNVWEEAQLQLETAAG